MRPLRVRGLGLGLGFEVDGVMCEESEVWIFGVCIVGCVRGVLDDCG